MGGNASVKVDGDSGPVVAVSVDTGKGAETFLVPEPVALTAFMIDRVYQLRGVQRLLKRRLEERRLGPLLVVLRGDVGDFHEGFAQRYERLEARKRLDLAPDVAPLTPLRVLHWPRRRVTLDELLLSFAGPLPNLEDGDEPEDVHRELRNLPESVSFRHILKASDWNAHHETLVRDWLAFVESDWPDPANAIMAIGFLCVQTDDTYPKESEALRKSLQELERAYAQSDRVYFAPELEAIERVDVEEWHPTAEKRLGADFHAGLLARLCDTLFEATDKYRYAALYRKMMTDIEKWYAAHARAQFTEE